MKLKRPLRGGERGADVRMVQRALNRWTRGAVALPLSGEFDRRTQDRLLGFQLEQGITPARGDLGQTTLAKLAPYFDAYGKMRYRAFRLPSALPDLGPFVEGEPSVLDHDLTHATGGFPTATHRTKYPAFDGGFGAGKKIIAPEPLRVYRASSARRRDGRPNGKAFYARGVSGIEYWVGHTTDVPPISLRARLTRGRAGPLTPKGAFLTTVSANHEVPHGHFGIDASGLIGFELAHRTDYRHGAPTVREQFERALR